MNLIVVVDNKWGIGKNNGLLFRLPRDMRFFRETTTGKVVVMGANTFRSFKGGALPNRINIVLDASGVKHDGATTVSTVDELMRELAKYNTDDVFVCGGASFYKLMLPLCKTAFVTKVQSDGGAELFFPNLDILPEWQLVGETEPEQDNGHVITFCTYQNTAI